MQEQVIKFVKEFIHLDHAIRIARYTIRDDDEFSKLVHDIDPLIDKDVDFPYNRWIGDSEEKWQRFKVQLDRVVKRNFLKLIHYKKGDSKQMFAAYLSEGESSPRGRGTRYDYCLYIEEKKGQLKILSLYDSCPYCGASGKRGGVKCEECAGRGWQRRSGKEIKAPGKAVEVVRFETPTDPSYKAAHELT